MKNVKYKLIKKKSFELCAQDEFIGENDIVVRPTYLSICAADLRYYNGSRPLEVMKQKLPLTLIHEAVGKVVYDPKGLITEGTKTVLVPLMDQKKNNDMKGNYNPLNKFRSSSTDGFMQKLCVIDRDEVIPYYNTDETVAVFSELLAVVYNSLEEFEKTLVAKKELTIGVWGNGTLGYLLSLVLTKTYDNIKVILFSRNNQKSDCFTFVDEVKMIDSDLSGVTVDYGFECVGGKNSSSAINQIIDIINPQGTISLLGVSEDYAEINTRMVLEKGLKLLGHSRAAKIDFEKAVNFVDNNDDASELLKRLISEEIIVKNIDDMNKAFEASQNNKFKTLMKWEV